MRIQIAGNKDCPDFGEEAYVRSPEGQNYRLLANNKYPMLDAFLCEHCGTEAYAYWRTKEWGVGACYPNGVYNGLYRNSFVDHWNQSEIARIINQQYTEHFRSCKAERQEFLRSDAAKFCPVCGEPFSKIQDSFEGWCDRHLESAKKAGLDYYEWILDFRYRNIHSKYSNGQKEQSVAKRKTLVESYELQYSVTALSFSSTAATLKTDHNQLKAYLQNLIQLETNIIALPKYLEKLYYQYSITQAKARSLDSAQVAEQYKNYIACMDRVASCKITYENPIYPACPTAPSEPEYQKPGLFNKKKIEAENKTLENKYRAQMKAYEQSLRQYEQTVAAIQADAKDKYRVAVYEAKEAKTSMENLRLTMRSASSGLSLENATQQMLGTEIKRVEELLRKTYQTRSEMYALNVVFGKYRDLVAVSTFYEYLMAGRCTSLEGVNGAYNLYESEVRANMIIDKLSDVVKKLDKLQQTQYTIYSQLRTMNSTLTSLSCTMDTACNAILDMNKSVSRIAENTDVIAYNTAATAYYSKVNAELTNAMGYMMAYKL